MLTSIDQSLRGPNMVNLFRYSLTSTTLSGKLSSDCYINSSNYTINSILLSEQQAPHIRIFDCKH